MPRQGNSIFNMTKILGKPLEEVDKIIGEKEKNINKIVIPKKDGSNRNIIAPGRDLKYIQKSIYWRFFRRYKDYISPGGYFKDQFERTAGLGTILINRKGGQGH